MDENVFLPWYACSKALLLNLGQNLIETSLIPCAPLLRDGWRIGFRKVGSLGFDRNNCHDDNEFIVSSSLNLVIEKKKFEGSYRFVRSMVLNKQSTVIFVHSTAHWEAIQQQRAQILGVASPSPEEQEQKKKIKQAQRHSYEREPEPRKKPSRLIGKEGSRRRQRWTNNTFSEHPNAVLYAEDLRPPGYKEHDKDLYQQLTEILSNDDNPELLSNSSIEKQVTPQVLSRHIRHDLKKSHISQAFITNYESQLLKYIDNWLDDPTCLENACLTVQVVSNNKFERYILHVMCRYYGFYSFSETNPDNMRITFVCHPAYMDYLTTKDKDSIDFEEIDNWIMPEKSFFDYLFHQ